MGSEDAHDFGDALGDLADRELRRAHRAFLPAGDVAHVLAGEVDGAVGLEKGG